MGAIQASKTEGQVAEGLGTSQFAWEPAFDDNSYLSTYSTALATLADTATESGVTVGATVGRWRIPVNGHNHIAIMPYGTDTDGDKFVLRVSEERWCQGRDVWVYRPLVAMDCQLGTKSTSGVTGATYADKLVEITDAAFGTNQCQTLQDFDNSSSVFVIDAMGAQYIIVEGTIDLTLTSGTAGAAFGFQFTRF